MSLIQPVNCTGAAPEWPDWNGALICHICTTCSTSSTRLLSMTLLTLALKTSLWQVNGAVSLPLLSLNALSRHPFNSLLHPLTSDRLTSATHPSSYPHAGAKRVFMSFYHRRTTDVLTEPRKIGYCEIQTKIFDAESCKIKIFKSTDLLDSHIKHWFYCRVWLYLIIDELVRVWLACFSCLGAILSHCMCLVLSCFVRATS